MFCALGCLEIIVDLVVAVVFVFFLLVFLLLTGCFYLEYKVLSWLGPFSWFFFDG